MARVSVSWGLGLTLFLVLSAGAGCTVGEHKPEMAVETADSFAQVPLPEKMNSIAAVYRRAEELEGRVVELRGTFEGWSRCTDSSAIVTRSDWVFQDGSTCVFVTGGLPMELQPSEQADRGTPIAIRAEVLYSRGKLTLQLVETVDVGIK